MSGESGRSAILIEAGALDITEVLGTRPLREDRNGLVLTIEDVIREELAPGVVDRGRWPSRIVRYCWR